MRAVDIIRRKRDKQTLTWEEISFFIQGYVEGDIPDYQAAAWAMAVLLNGMNDEETSYLTFAMVEGGEMLDLSHVDGIVVDKHSSGGVGDKTSIAVAPMVRACGVLVGKMSGRGLGFSGGTLDKLEAIPGYRVNLSKREFMDQLDSLGLVLTGQSVDLAPADGKLYALRDVTGTVQSIPLIASSIMSKKIAAGSQGVVLDVKTGNGAFMQDLEEARRLAKLMVAIGHAGKKDVVALLSDMNQPLGIAVGNALETKEAIITLKGEGPDDFVEHCLEVASHMILLAKKADTKLEAREMAKKSIDSGRGFAYLEKLVAAQGGDVDVLHHPDKLPEAPIKSVVEAPKSGKISEVHARRVGETAVLLGAGRRKKGDAVDQAVGISVLVKVGQAVSEGDPLFVIHARKESDIEPAQRRLISAVGITEEEVQPLPLFYGLVT